MHNYNLLNGTTLAYIGDAYYELYVRKYLIDLGFTKANQLHKKAVHYVSAKQQASVVKFFSEEQLLNDDEVSVIKRGRNAKVNTGRKNTDILTYKHSTSFEALIGYLYLTDQQTRMLELIKMAINYLEENR